MPDAVPTGTKTSTSMVQEVPAVTVPPEPIKNVVPDIEVPQVFVVAGNTAARPGITLPRLSVKKETVKSKVVVLSIVNRSVVTSPGITGSSINSLVKVTPPTRRSSVATFPVPV